MIITKPYARLLAFDQDGNQEEFTRRHGIGLLRKIEWNARISHRTEDAQTPDSWERFVSTVVMNHGDWSVVEHASATVDALIDRGVSHEWVRHRLASFTQSSTRFINHAKKMPPEFILPGGLTDDATRASNGEQTELSQLQLWHHAIDTSESVYRQLIARGVAPQIARSVFPNALSTRITTTCNLRQWRHFCIMRTTKEAHPQMREVAIPLLLEFKAKVPLIFDDIEPLQRQADNLRLPR